MLVVTVKKAICGPNQTYFTNSIKSFEAVAVQTGRIKRNLESVWLGCDYEKNYYRL
jgi:hypothetical protein